MDQEQAKKLEAVKARIAAERLAKEQGKTVQPMEMPKKESPKQPPPVPANVKQAVKVATPIPFHPSLKPEYFVYYSRVPGSKYHFADGSVATFTAQYDPKTQLTIGIYKTPNPAKAKELDGALGQVIYKLERKSK